ncbi:histidine phosphatase superfamily [Tricladium varicosporioides]|nr:histidine phosphatase superfamily [Hymenoscyphus varicosporioides]
MWGGGEQALQNKQLKTTTTPLPGGGMRLLLIRHGETVDNVAGVYAGITDSALTNHGVLQANRLASHLAATEVKISRIFSSDLQRAARTADAIHDAQDAISHPVTRLEILREQDFGFYEGKQFFERPRHPDQSSKEAHLAAHRNNPGFKDVESKSAMMARMESFIESHLLQLIHDIEDECSVVVVAHGIILSYLWRSIVRRFHPNNVAVATGIVIGDRGIEYLGGWSNTGYLDLEVKQRPDFETKSGSSIDHSEKLVEQPPSTTEKEPSLDHSVPPQSPIKTVSPPSILHTSPTIAKPAESQLDLFNMSLVVKAVNSQLHLRGLKKTRGGLGSLKHDPGQQTMDSFFNKKRRTR